MARKAKWQLVVGSAAGKGVVVIRDVGPWDTHPSVTNDAEGVIEDLATRGLLQRGERCFYFDSEGEPAELRVSDAEAPRFVGFGPVTQAEIDAACDGCDTEENEAPSIEVLYLVPGAVRPTTLRVEKGASGIEWLRALLGGHFDRIQIEEGVDVWVNDEGLLNGMQPHPTLGLRGPLVIARHEGPETTSIRPSDATEGRWLVMSGAIRMYAVRAGLLGHDGNGRLVPVDPPPPLVLDSYREVDVIGWARTHRPAIEHALDVARTALLADVRTLAEKAEREDKSEPERAALKRLSEEFQRYVARIEAAVEALPW